MILLDFRPATTPLISAGILRGSAAYTVAISISSSQTGRSVLEPSPSASKQRHLLILPGIQCDCLVKRVIKSLGGRALIIGVDRLDYSKGIAERLSAF